MDIKHLQAIVTLLTANIFLESMCFDSADVQTNNDYFCFYSTNYSVKVGRTYFKWWTALLEKKRSFDFKYSFIIILVLWHFEHTWLSLIKRLPSSSLLDAT